MGDFIKWVIGTVIVLFILALVINTLIITGGYALICFLSPLEFQWSTAIIISIVVTLVQLLLIPKK